jgi:hypothetical protein
MAGARRGLTGTKGPYHCSCRSALRRPATSAQAGSEQRSDAVGIYRQDTQDEAEQRPPPSLGSRAPAFSRYVRLAGTDDGEGTKNLDAALHHHARDPAHGLATLGPTRARWT